MNAAEILPSDAADAVLVGRLLDPDTGPCLVHLRDDRFGIAALMRNLAARGLRGTA